MRRAPLLLLAAPLTAQLVVACTTDRLDLGWNERGTLAVPPDALIADIPPFDAGDGHHGDLVIGPDETQVVNDCRALTSAAGSTVTPASVAGLVSGDLYLVMQVQANFATAGPSLDVTNPDDAGNWEIRRVTSVGIGNATLASALEGSYSSEGTRQAQMCAVPEYRDASVAGTLTAETWNGTRGGVLALLVSGTLTLDGAFDASAAGFRGGVVSSNNTATTVTAETTGIGTGGGRGEGLDGRSFSQHGRGAMGNAAGGGNARNAGGGGGGGGGTGGFGGKQYSSDGDSPNTRGRAGGRLALPILERLSFGGGGGGGQQNGSSASPGARGGGIVLVYARTLTGAGTISANGADAAPTTSTDQFTDGAGGGGGGGTVLLRSATAFWGSVSAQGGAGGDAFTLTDGTTHYGGGGGGGGGRIAVPVFLSDRTDVSEGRAGINLDDGNEWDADAGSPGVVESAF